MRTLLICIALVKLGLVYGQTRLTYSIDYVFKPKLETPSQRTFYQEQWLPKVDFMRTCVAQLDLCTSGSRLLFEPTLNTPDVDPMVSIELDHLLRDWIYVDDNAYYQDTVGSDRRLIEVDYALGDWEINTKDQIIINGYITYKATRSIVYSEASNLPDAQVTAWFAPALAINTPFQEAIGLPGAIIRFQDKDQRIQYTLECIERIDDCDVNITDATIEGFTKVQEQFALMRSRQ